MSFRRLAIMGASAALACALPAMAQAPASKLSSDANKATFSLAGQADASGNFHYRDVMEGLTPQAAPVAWYVDANGLGHISIDQQALPSNASTAAAQALELTTIQGLATHADMTALIAAEDSALTSTQLGAAGLATHQDMANLQAAEAAGLTLSQLTGAGLATHSDMTALLAAQGAGLTLAQLTGAGLATHGDMTALLAAENGGLTLVQLSGAGLGTDAHAAATAAGVGAPADAVCAGSTSACSLEARMAHLEAQTAQVLASLAQVITNTGNTNAVPVTIASGQLLGITSLPGTPAQTADVTGVSTAVGAASTLNHADLASVAARLPGGGGTGLSYGANKPTLPNVGANFAASGPYASYVLVATVPAVPTRSSVDIENNSGAQIVVVRDDGTAASGAAPVNASAFPLAGGSGVGSQGGAWTSQTFKGRLQLYAPSTVTNPQIAAMVE